MRNLNLNELRNWWIMLNSSVLGHICTFCRLRVAADAQLVHVRRWNECWQYSVFLPSLNLLVFSFPSLMYLLTSLSRGERGRSRIGAKWEWEKKRVRCCLCVWERERERKTPDGFSFQLAWRGRGLVERLFVRSMSPFPFFSLILPCSLSSYSLGSCACNAPLFSTALRRQHLPGSCLNREKKMERIYWSQTCPYGLNKIFLNLFNEWDGRREQYLRWFQYIIVIIGV